VSLRRRILGPMPTIKDSDTRQRVLRWKLRGWSARRIADKLAISTQSVYYHLHKLEDAGELENGVKHYRRRSA
jgi:DNA-binding CsgD family transcriptional regulator